MEKEEPLRADGRRPQEARAVHIVRGFQKFAEGSVLIETGQTRVICSASVEDKVPPFLKDTGRGWVTAEYGMLPRSTSTRISRERAATSGRTLEIQRFIGRSLRATIDLEALGPRTITLDCDVLQADGGTRTAAITGAMVALVEACGVLHRQRAIGRWPIGDLVAAVSVGMIDNRPCLDLDYVEDVRAGVDMNVAMLASGRFVEVQGTAERDPYDRQELDRLVDLAAAGIRDLFRHQLEALADFREILKSGNRWLRDAV